MNHQVSILKVFLTLSLFMFMYTCTVHNMFSKVVLLFSSICCYVFCQRAAVPIVLPHTEEN